MIQEIGANSSGNLNPHKPLTNNCGRKHIAKTLREENIPPTDIMLIYVTAL